MIPARSRWMWLSRRRFGGAVDAYGMGGDDLGRAGLVAVSPSIAIA
jgi:hypothetical protein